MKNELMIDIETTWQKPGCKVLSLGAFGFNKDGKQCEFYVRFAIDKQRLAGLTDDHATISWLNRQNKEVRDEAFGGKTDPAEGLTEFKKFFYANFSTDNGDGFKVWCCGLDFDFPILQNFMGAFGFSLPWKFWTQFDYRTIKNLFAYVKPSEGNVAAHNALEDCKAQMRGLRAFYDRMAKHPEAWTE